MPDFLDPTSAGVGDYRMLMDLFDETEQEIDEMRESGYRVARFQSDYRMKVAVMTMRLKADGMPVTIISDLVRGDEEIARLKLEWVRAEADNNASKHKIFLNEKKIDVLNDQIKREWYRPSNA